MITSKEYLTKIRKLDIMISQKERELADLNEMKYANGGFTYSERVKTSVSNKNFEDKAIKAADLEAEINDEKNRFTVVKHNIINEIQMLEEPKHITILFKIYVENKKLNKIAKEMHYSIRQIKYIHREALNEFQEVVILKKYNNRVS